MTTDIILNDVEALFNKIVQHPRALWRSILDLECVGRPPEFRKAVEQLLDADIEASGKSKFLVPLAVTQVVDRVKAALDAFQRGEASTVDWRRLAPRETSQILPPGTTIGGDYTLEEMIGRGGMGVVYKAHQQSLDRTVALKITSSEHYASEAQAAAHLDHPGIVPVFEVGCDSGRHFFTMAFVNGRSLHDMLKDGGPFTPRNAASTTAAIAMAIDYAHSKGVIHRDIKPANALIDEQGRPRVVDFGLARRIRIGDTSTDSDVIVGTLEYMSPEVAAGSPATPLSDVYSLGAMFYCLLVGRPPFRGSDTLDILHRIRRQYPTPPLAFNKSLPRDLDTICLKCLDKSPQNRYPNAAALAEDLTRWLQNRPIRARQRTRRERIYHVIRNNMLVTASLLLALTGCCFAIGAILTNLIAEPRRPLTAQASDTSDLFSEDPPDPIPDPDKLANALPVLIRDSPDAAAPAIALLARIWPTQKPFPTDLHHFARTTAAHITLARSASPLRALTFGDDTSLATVSADGQLRAWDPVNTAPPWTERLKTTLEAPITAAAFNDQGTWLCTATPDHGITLTSLIPNVDSQTVTVPNLGSTVSRLVYAGMPISRPDDPNTAATTDTSPANARLKPQEYFHCLAAFTESGVHLWNSWDNCAVSLEDQLSHITLDGMYSIGRTHDDHIGVWRQGKRTPESLPGNYLVAKNSIPFVTRNGDTFQICALTLGDLPSATKASTSAVVTDLTPMLIYRPGLSESEMLALVFGVRHSSRPVIPKSSCITQAVTNDNPVASMLRGAIRDRNCLRGGSVEILVGSNDSSLYSAAACQGSHLAVATGRTVHCWDSETTNTHTDTFTAPADVVALAVSGEWLAAALADHRIMLWNRKGLSDAPLILPTDNHPITKLIISIDETWLAGVSDSMLQIWPVNIQSVLQVLKNKRDS